jgi:hypothetical protein
MANPGFEKPFGITAGAVTQPFSETAADKTGGLGHRRLAPRDRSGTVRADFRDNAIDADVLCDLTDEHLRASLAYRLGRASSC